MYTNCNLKKPLQSPFVQLLRWLDAETPKRVLRHEFRIILSAFKERIPWESPFHGRSNFVDVKNGRSISNVFEAPIEPNSRASNSAPLNTLRIAVQYWIETQLFDVVSDTCGKVQTKLFFESTYVRS
jgi:hypothetical protein